jgi:hypothetical protein
LDTVTPASARGGAEVTLTGDGFGTRGDASAVLFRATVGGAAPVAGDLVDWAADTIVVRVPPLASFDSAGPLEITVHTDDGDSEPLAFVIEDDTPPALTTVVPVRGLQRDVVTLTGQHLGRRTGQSAVLFQAPGPADVVADIVSWTATSVTARVPSLDTLGGAGPRPITVATAWGRSGTVAFELGELPQITSVEPASPSPGAVVTVRGRAFGPPATGTLRLVAVYASGDTTAPVSVTSPQILSWTDTEIVLDLPELQDLLTTGARDVVITTTWGTNVGDARSRILIESRASITCWTRVEPHARTADLQQGLDEGLQAQVYDALWLLGRQWQMLELRGQDAGTPVNVRVQGKATPLARWQPKGGQPEHVPKGVPLEAVAERERVVPPITLHTKAFDDLRLAAETGQQLLRFLADRLHDSGKAALYRRRFLQRYGLRVPDGAAPDVATRRFLAVTEGRVPDGSEIYGDFPGVLLPVPILPNQPPIDPPDRPEVIAALRDWYDWCADFISEPSPGQFAWDRQRMEYSFAAGSGPLVLDAREHDGGHLDWYSFVRRAPGGSLGSPAPGRGPATFTRSAIPSPVGYPGMPVPRWWEMEDRQVDFGSVAAGPSELLKLVLVEFASVFGNDWFTVMLDGMPVGSLLEIVSVTVTDAFGVTSTVTPFGDGAGTDWRMFELANADGTADAGHAMLLLDSLPTTDESAPLEDVLLLRDELANMAWAVEKTVPSIAGRPLDRHEDEVVRRETPEPEPAATMRKYVLRTPIPRNWIPLLPRFDRDSTGAVTRRMLARGAIREHAGGPGIPPQGRLLEPGTPLDLFDEEVPRTSVRVRRLWTLGRAADGSMHLWRARRKDPGRGTASAGLRFDDAPPV